VKNARDLVVVAVGYGYLQIIEDAARIMATNAEIDSDNAIFLNAKRRHDSGVAIGIDVLRSQVELKQRQQALVAQQNQLAKDKLTLGRSIGLPLGQDFVVSDPSPNVPLSAMPIDEALKEAYANRSDYQAAKDRVRAAEFSLRGSKAERYPTAQAQGDYGAEGLQLFTNSHGVFSASASVNFNIFDGGRIKGDILQSDAQLTNARNDLANLRGQIDYDVRSALLDLKSASDQVDVAQGNVGLAEQTLKESRDRFVAGVTNTVEVVQSQQTVADANENLISAQYQLNVAKVELAHALGIAEQGVKDFFAHKHP
jgi:outer membrane protein TolC